MPVNFLLCVCVSARGSFAFFVSFPGFLTFSICQLPLLSCFQNVSLLNVSTFFLFVCVCSHGFPAFCVIIHGFLTFCMCQLPFSSCLPTSLCQSQWMYGLPLVWHVSQTVYNRTRIRSSTPPREHRATVNINPCPTLPSLSTCVTFCCLFLYI